MDCCSTSCTPNGLWRGLYSGVVVAGIGMGLVVGQGVAFASPSDSPGAAQSGDTTDAGPSVSKKSRTHDTAASTGEDSPEPADEVEESEGADESDEAATDVADGAESSDGSDDDASVAASVDDEAAPKSRQRQRLTDTTDDPSEDAAVPAIASAEGVTAAVAPDAVPSASPTTVRGLVSARPVTVANIVTDMLTWAGVQRSVDDVPIPAAPVSALVQSLWLAVRQTQYTWNNQRPTADATISGPGPGGAVTGSLNAVDYDDAALTYTIAAGPTHGRVVVDAQGLFSYTPGAAAAGRADQFTVRIDDVSGNPFHVHGLLGLLGITRPTEVTVLLPGSPARQSVSSDFEMDELVSRGVEVTTDGGGAVSVIEGRFTDQVVVTAADAAVVLNAMAPAFGASSDFADASAITASTMGVGDTAEHFYRFTETVGGVPVLGSEVVLVTDARGQVTSLFNYYRGVGQGFDITPDASVDEDVEVRLIAGTAYVGAGAPPEVVESLLAHSAFTKELVVYTIDDATPSLAWRTVVRLPDAGDMATPGATYLIDADGAGAGDIIVTISNVQPASAVTVARDWLGDSRSITISTRTVLWFRTSEMVDGGRNITTYKTSYSLWGLGGATLPGKVVKRSLFGWDRAAVSAHANIALVYDYYENVLGRTSFDDKGAPVVVSIKYSPRTGVGYANAFWDPLLSQFAFGDSGYLQAAVDIVAHEYTHAVVTSIVGNGSSVLDQGESGALNEAYADILGLLVEGKTGADRWLIGEDSDLGAIRNLADPTSIRSGSSYYRDRYGDRYIGAADDGGEHINSTIFGRAAYLMMTDAATTGVSAQAWAQVFYHSLGRLNGNAKFVDARAAVLSAAQTQGLTLAQRTAIAEAFDTVEIFGAAPSSAVAV